MKKRSLILGLGAAMLTLSLGAFAAGAETLIDSISVVAGSEDAMQLNTSVANTLEAISADRHIYEGLYKLDQNSQLVLGQAASEEISEDGLTITYTLRDDITWSDGVAVTAQDFVYGWTRLAESGGDYATIMDMVESYEATDDKTLVVHMNYACGYFPAILAFPSAFPVREDVAQAQGESYATDPDKAVYNGAYEVTDWVHQSVLTMTKREDYYDADAVTVGTIEWQLMTDNTTKTSSFQSGDVIYADSVVEEQASLLEGNGLQYASGYCNYCCMFNLETGNDVLKDAKVRKALALAVNRERLVNVRSMNDTVAYTYTPAGLTDEEGNDFLSVVDPWYSEDYEANCEEAKALLAEAGYPDGEGFPALRYIVGNEDRKQIAEAVVGDWNNILGIDSITVETVENFFATRSSGDYDIAYYGWYMDYADISNMLHTMTTGSNNAFYSSEEYDAAYNAAISATDTATQWENYAKCEAILAEDVPVVPFFHPQNSYLFDDVNYGGLVYYCSSVYFGYLTQN